ncbi:MAG: BLUF domain-containing protein, partial [Comamonadaceae bacterium]
MYSAVYVSEVVPQALGRDPEALQAALAALQATSDANNRRNNVRGLLVCGQDHFLQWLQGEEALVRALLERIATDPRHRAMQVVHAGPCDAELDAGSTTLLSRAATDPQVDEVLRNLRGGRLPAAPPGPGGVPAAIVRRLVKPGPPDGGRQRVGLFGQNGVWSGALMAHLEAKWASPLSRTRLLGSLGLERAALIEHLDHHDPEHGALTVVNYSSDLLSASWMQGCVAPLGVAALVFSGTTEDGVAGFARQVLAQLGPPHARARLVCLFGRTAARFLPAVQEVLGASGHDVLYSA